MHVSLRVLCTTLAILLVVSPGTGSAQDDAKWYIGLRTMIRRCATWNKTQHDVFLEAFRNCVQKRVLTSLNYLLMEDVIPVVSGINLIRLQDDRINVTKDVRSRDEANDATLNRSLTEVLWKRVTRVLRTHAIKIDIDCLTSNSNATGESEIEDGKDAEGDAVVLSRRRRHRRRQHMMPLMMMGLLLMGSILIPMGFQFLAVLGGKALILAKMALILSSIQGLKKIATNGVNYGLYHSPVVESWHDRSDEESPTRFDLPYPVPPPHYHP